MSALTASPYQSYYSIDDDQHDAYHRDGHILLRNVDDTSAVEQFRQALHDTLSHRPMDQRPLEDRDTYGRAFQQVVNVWVDGNSIVRDFVLSERFASIAGRLMDADGVRLYHDQALFKEAGGGYTPWHQDQHYWPMDTNQTITMWMPLVDIEPDMGALAFASGSHQSGYLGSLPISDESEARFAAYCAEHNFDIVKSGPMKAGDATFHSGWCLHSAPGNSSNRCREVMTVIYMADGARILPHPDSRNRWNDNRWTDLRAWFPGVKPGDLAAGELSPLLYPRPQ